MREILISATAVLSTLAVGPPVAAYEPGSGDGVDAAPYGEDVVLSGTDEHDGDETGADTASDASSEPTIETRSLVVCNPTEVTDRTSECALILSYCAPGEQFAEHFQRSLVGSDQRWKIVEAGCEYAESGSPGQPILTPDDIREAVRRIGLPASTMEVPVETLVNYDTTVYTRPVTFERTVTLLGYTVDVRAEPSSYAWIYGDGQREQTATPGQPYPADDITHAWADAHRTFHPRVDTTYTVRFRVDGGPWLGLGDTLTVEGPDAAVRIREATGMLAEMN